MFASAPAKGADIVVGPLYAMSRSELLQFTCSTFTCAQLLLASQSPVEARMLFGGCNCIPGASFLSAYGSLCAGGAGFVSAMIATMVAGARTASAPNLGREIPEVDRLAVRMVTDNIVIQFVPPATHGDVAIERLAGGNTKPDAPPRTALNGEWGLSMHAQSRRGDEERNVLVDFGYTPEVLLNNMSILNIDPATFDALVLSHGHYDHFGGMVGFLAANRDRLKRKIPFFVGGEDTFCIRRTATGGQLSSTDSTCAIADCRAIHAAGTAHLVRI